VQKLDESVGHSGTDDTVIGLQKRPKTIRSNNNLFAFVELIYVPFKWVESLTTWIFN